MIDKPKSSAVKPAAHPGQRIAKAMARAGLCSRRDAEEWIAAGRVSVNGKTLDSPAFNVTERDDVRVDGKPMAAPERTRLFLFNKPRGLVTTAKDPEGRPTIFEALPEDLPRVVAVGRLDINTEGLLLLTNDGGLARVLELPATGWLRRYRVRAHGEVEQALLDPLAQGITIDGVNYAGIDAKLDRSQGANVWITMGLREGKNREIKRVLEHLGLGVNRLIRISFGPFELGDLGEGEVAEVRTRVLKDQLGIKLAREAGVNFDADIVDRVAPPAPAAPMGGERRSPGKRDFKPKGPSYEEREAAAKADPKRSYGPKMRKHVSALREEIRSGGDGPRKRIERGATADRAGREVKVERLLPTREETLRRELAKAAKLRRAGDRKPAKDRFRGAGQSERSGGREAKNNEGRGAFGDAGADRVRRDAPRSARTAAAGMARSAPAPTNAPRARDAKPAFRKAPPRGDGAPASRDGAKPARKGPPRERDGKRPFFRKGPPHGDGPRKPPRRP